MAYKLTRYIINAGVKIVSAAVMLEVTLGRSNWRQEALLHHPAAGNVLGWSCFTASTVTPRCCVASSRGGLVSGPLPCQLLCHFLVLFSTIFELAIKSS